MTISQIRNTWLRRSLVVGYGTIYLTVMCLLAVIIAILEGGLLRLRGGARLPGRPVRAAAHRVAGTSQMSNLWINWRLWYWHMQIGPDRPHIRFSFNHWRWERGRRSPWIELNGRLHGC